MLKIENLNTGYDKKQVLFDVSLEVAKGDIALLIGSNGSGKSTLLKSIYGICPIWSGKIFFEGEDITNLPPHKLLQKGIVYAPQKNNLFDQLTVKENIEISGITLDRKIYKNRYEAAIEQFPALQPLLKRHPMKMSGGERQQLVLSMALMHRPKLLMIDEPFSGLDSHTTLFLCNKFLSLNKEFDVNFIISEHKLKEAFPLASNIISLKIGHIFKTAKNPDKTLIDYFDNVFL